MAALVRWVGRAIGLDVHRDFCVVAICEDGQVRSAGRVPSTPEGIKALAESLLPTDRVALEVTGSCWEIARILEPHVNRVVGRPEGKRPGPRVGGGIRTFGSHTVGARCRRTTALPSRTSATVTSGKPAPPGCSSPARPTRHG